MQKEDFKNRCARLRERLCDADFLANKGLGNEAGIFTFCYDPTLELEARDYFRRLVADADAGKLGAGDVKARIHERNLYDVLLQICEGKRILDKLPAQEEKRGQDGLLKQIQDPAHRHARGVRRGHGLAAARTRRRGAHNGRGRGVPVHARS